MEKEDQQQAYNSFKYFLFYWIPVILYCFLIYIQSANPSPEIIPPVPYIDKLLHFIAYALLAVLFYRAYKELSFKIVSVILLSIMSSSLYGISDEIHQYFVPWRTADFWDAFSDFIGSIFGAIICYKFFYEEKKI
ncbi:MAG: VanZ family protein [Desulfobacterales bacterium]|nr:VanZ family protein [Desulfobacterales bacterium]